MVSTVRLVGNKVGKPLVANDSFLNGHWDLL